MQSIEQLSARIGQEAELLASQMRTRGWMLATAESCTGGLLAGAITDLPGSSDWFERGYVTYSNEAKQDELGVTADALHRYGAVSEQVAAQMAAGVLKASVRPTLSLATTGIAGPGGATDGKPVGMVCFGMAWRDAGEILSRTETCLFAGDRRQVRLAAVEFALRLARHFSEMR
ncbi:CinA family protein [Alcaligenaceae bacterium SJ-26]|nr:CinA family protein [Alcaligenaceae bacterium SJ-26]